MRASLLMTSTWGRSNMKRSGCTLSESSSHPSRSRSSLDTTPRWGDAFEACTVRYFLTLDSNVDWNHVYASGPKWWIYCSTHQRRSLSICLSSFSAQFVWRNVDYSEFWKGEKKQTKELILSLCLEWKLLFGRCMCVWLDKTLNETPAFKTSAWLVFHAGLCCHELCGEVHS